MPIPALAAKWALKKGVERFASRGEENEKKPGSFKRKFGATVLAVGVAAGVAYGAKEYAENEMNNVLPHDVGKAQVESTLGEVSLSGDTILLNGEGGSTANLSLHSESEMPFSDETFVIPGTSMDASAEIDAKIDVIAEQDAIKLESFKHEASDEWRVQATVNENGLTSQLSEKSTVEATNDEGLVNRVVNVFYEGEQPQDANNFLESVADNNFQAACAPELSEAVPAATASHVKNNIEQTASLLEEQDPKAHEILADLSENPIHIAFENNNVVANTSVNASQLDLDAPEPVESMNKEIDIPGATASGAKQFIDAEITTQGDECEVSDEAKEKLNQFNQQNSFVLEN